MTTSSPGYPLSRLLPRLLLVGATLMPSACAAQAPTCSDPQVAETVKELVLKRLSENYGLTAMYDLPATRIDLRAIRTVASDTRQATCRTELGIEFQLNDELKAAMANPPSNPTEAQMMQSMFGNTSRSVDLGYLVKLTDDGQEFYVTIDGF